MKFKIIKLMGDPKGTYHIESPLGPIRALCGESSAGSSGEVIDGVFETISKLTCPSCIRKLVNFIY